MAAGGRVLFCLHPRWHVAEDTPVPAIEDAFKRFTEREDIAIVLINQYVRDPLGEVPPDPAAAARAFCLWRGGVGAWAVAARLLDRHPSCVHADGPTPSSLSWGVFFLVLDAVVCSGCCPRAVLFSCRLAWPVCFVGFLCLGLVSITSRACCSIRDAGCGRHRLPTRSGRCWPSFPPPSRQCWKSPPRSTRTTRPRTRSCSGCAICWAPREVFSHMYVVHPSTSSVPPVLARRLTRTHPYAGPVEKTARERHQSPL